MGLVKLILKAPRSIQLPFRYAYGLLPPRLKFGRAYGDTLKFLDKTEFWDRDLILEYQSDRLRDLVHHAYEFVPYYRETFDRLGILPTDIRTIYDIEKLPFLTKEIIQARRRDLVARNFSPSQLQYVTTGGSTGVPLGLFEDGGIAAGVERAFIVKQWERIGFRPGDRTAVFRGAVVSKSDSGRLWEYNPTDQTLVFSSYHLTDDQIPRMVERLSKFRPRFIQAYPSAIYMISEYMRRNGLPAIASVKGILCGSENLYQFQRDSIQKAFGCRVYSWYGHAEKTVLAGECEISSQYHAFPEYGITELIGEDGRAVIGENQTGEIVGTSLQNMAFPLIRYRTMDLAKLGSRSCECGRNHLLLKSVEGRLQELIISREGRYVSMTALNMHNDVFDRVKQFQFYQDQPGSVTLNILRQNEYSEADSVRILSEISRKLGDGFELSLNFVDEIPRTTAGKYRFALQKLPLAHGDR